MSEFTEEKFEELREERRIQDETMLVDLTNEYGFDVSKYTSVSPNWHHGLIWDSDKIVKDLKVCPFCGGKGIIEDIEYEDGISYAIICDDCGAQSKEFDRLLDAFVAWNKRI